jgi:hypothetical protein
MDGLSQSMERPKFVMSQETSRLKETDQMANRVSLHRHHAEPLSFTLIRGLHKVLERAGIAPRSANSDTALPSGRAADPKVLRSYEDDLRFTPWRNLQRNY